MKRAIVAFLACVLIFCGCGSVAEKGTGVPPRGIWNGNTYTNDAAGLKIVLPDGYTRYTDEQLTEFTGITKEAYADAENQSMYVDAKIHTADYTGNFTLRYFVSDRPGVTDEQYMNLVKTYRNTATWGDGSKVKKLFSDTKYVQLGGNSYCYSEYVYEGHEDEYRCAVIFRYIDTDILCYIDLEALPECFEDYLALITDM